MKLTLHEDLYSTSPQHGVYKAVPAGTVINVISGSEKVTIYGSAGETFEVDVNSRKFSEQGTKKASPILNATNFVGRKELFSIADVIEARKKVRDSGANNAHYFLRMIMRMVTNLKGTIFIEDTEILEQEGPEVVTTISLAGFTEEHVQNDTRAYEGLLMDNAEYLILYLEAIYKGNIPPEVSVAASVMVNNPVERGVKYLLPFNNLVIKL